MAEHRGWHLHAAGAAWREPSWSMELRVRASNFKHQLGSNPYNYHETTPHATQRPRQWVQVHWRYHTFVAKFRGKLDDQPWDPWELSVTLFTPPEMVAGGSFFWSDERAPVQGSRVYGCYKEILREFVLDLQESWHEIRNDPEWHLHLHFLDLRVASKDSISRFHSCHSCHSWRVASFPRIWTKTIASRWTGVRCWDQFEALKSKLYGRFPQQKLGVQQNHGFSNQKWAIAGILLLFLGYPHWNRSPQMIWTPPWNDHDLRVFSPKDLLGSDAPFGTPIGSWNTQHG